MKHPPPSATADGFAAARQHLLVRRPWNSSANAINRHVPTYRYTVFNVGRLRGLSPGGERLAFTREL
jgi:hypothetical protein